eukprot:TRINITY_DN2818_c0_g5_i1.p1 TRINITY_DN2818_c0_g5~~TRINITY_DN2818_c0_g5_i1.p1  ORF type:complete len:271 (-),score=33.44 TRINITY_DN2818_c0_g5_i1:498-1310(-)
MEASLNYRIQVMINEEMVHILDVEMAKLLSLVSRFISNTVKQYIEDHFYFCMVTERRFTFYQPKCISNVTSISQMNALIRRAKFGFGFNECVDLSMFINFTHIRYGWNFNKSIENRLPPNLTRLSFHRSFNQPVDGFLPNKLTYLKLGYSFSHTISNLPRSLKRLKIRSCFNLPLENLPNGLTHLTLGHYFQQSLENKLPQSLTHLTIGSKFNTPIQTLPPKIKQVRFCGSFSPPKFNQPISHLNPNIVFQISYFSHGDFIVLPYLYHPK